MYKRKTEDEWHIMQYSPEYGWENICPETSRKMAKVNLRAYRDAEPGKEFKIIKKRVKIGQGVTT